MKLAPLAPGAPRVWTLPAGTGFLARLAQGLAHALELRENPGALADTLIFVPNSRSAQALALALFEAGGRDGLIAPDIRALGDLPGDIPSAMLSGVGLDLPPSAPAPQRLGILARLASQWARQCGLPGPPSSDLAMARELAGLMDQIAQQDLVGWSHLEDDIALAELARHWQDSARFMDILRRIWPEILAEKGWGEAEALRRAAADELAARWQQTPPPGPVILAGSTGTHPATRTLMRAIGALPQGLIVLPGLDRQLSPKALAACRAAPSHPQHALAVTLESLELSPQDVADWPVRVPGAPPERARLLAAALAPADDTADWLATLAELAGGEEPQAFVRRALAGLIVIDAADEDEEARACAVLLREGLETPNGLTALITPDAALGRRVSAELFRWGLDIAPTAGTPLLRTPAGSLLALASRHLADPADPIALCALLDHPLVRLGQSEAGHRQRTAELETQALRGPRVWETAPQLFERIAAVDPDLAAALSALARPPAAPGSPQDVRRQCEALASTIEALCASPEGSLAWRGPDGAAAASLLRDLADYGEAAGPVAPDAFPALLEAFAEEISLPDGEAGHPRLAIWGPLEARLQDADRVILASLNEGTWPQPPNAGSFLPRHFRIRVGLPDPEARIGLSAHDFFQLACAPQVYLVRARRVNNQPSVSSRWLWRLRTLSTGALKEGADIALGAQPAAEILSLAAALDRPVAPALLPARVAPSPCPPPSARPVTFGVTEIETLIRDPYAIYARNVLGLKPLDPVGAPFDARLRGTALHKAVERFASGVPPYGPARQLHALMCEELAREGMPGTDLRAASPLLADLAGELTAWLKARSPSKVEVERKLKADLTTPAGIFHLTGRADRIEHFADGAFNLYDFKTGQAATPKQVDSGLAPQLPLLAALLMQSDTKVAPAALAYVELRTAFAEKSALSKVADAEGLVAGTWDRLHGLLALWLQPDRPFLSNPVAQWAHRRGGDYDHLARRGEWADLGHAEDGAGEGAS